MKVTTEVGGQGEHYRMKRRGGGKGLLEGK